MKKLLLIVAAVTAMNAQAGIWKNIQSNIPSAARINLVSSTVDNSVVHLSIDGFYLNAVATPIEKSVTISLPGTTPILKKGTPDLPKITTSLIIPDLAEMEVKVISSQYIDYQNITIAPSKGNFTRDIDPASVPFTYGSPYQLNENFPGVLAATQDPYVLRDFRGQTVVLYPFQYNAVTKTLRVYYDMTVELKKVSDLGINPLSSHNQNQKTIKEFNKVYSNHFINYNPSKYTILEEEGDMLIIAFAGFIPAIQPFVEWKISKGIPVEVVDVSTIGNANTIKEFILNYYNQHNLGYVLLVGDHQQVPAFMSPNGASDNAYTYVAGTDHYNDFFIGRFSAENAEQVTTQVDKVLSYEINPPQSTNWFESCIGIGSSQGPGDDNEFDYQHIRNLQNLCNSYTYNTFYELFDGSQGGLDGVGNPSPAEVGNDINLGASVILYCGHGSQTSWGTSGFSNADVNTLNNNEMLPFIWSVACVNGDFTNGTCFAEAWLRAHHGDNLTGAIATLMSTINQSWDPPMEAEDEMVAVLTESYTNNIKRTFGGLSVSGMAKMIDSYAGGGESMADTWVLFGDPSVVVRTALPQNITATHDPVTFIGTTQFQVSCPVDGALACITLDNEILGTAIITNGAATITYPWALTTLGNLKLVITKYNYIPYIATIPINVATGPFVTYQAYYINDIQGNNNHLADFNESITLDLSLKNLGIVMSPGVIADINTTDAYVTITDSIEVFGDIDTNILVTHSNAYALSIANNIPDQHHIPVSVIITDTLGNTWNSNFTLTAQAPSFAIMNPAVNDSAGNNNGNLDAGETIILLIPTLNAGHSDALNTNGVLTSNCPYITINNGGYSLGTLTAGSQANAIFSISIQSNTPIGTNASFSYSVASGAYTAQKNFYKVVGIVDENFESGDFTHFSWLSTGSDMPWVVSTDNPYEGLYCSKSGSIADNQKSVMQVTMNVLIDDSISFYRKVSSEDTYDFLSFFIDNVNVDEWSGEKDWARVSYPVTAGTHTFLWRYRKDVMIAGGSDAAWVDYIVFPPVDLLTGIPDANNRSVVTLILFPNPTPGHFQIQYPLEVTSPVNIQLLDATGRLIKTLEQANHKSPGIYTLDSDLSHLDRGLYYVRLTSDRDVITTKLILNR